MARALGVDVVDLDLSVPFTAARARNVGYQHLARNVPGIELIQFVDGDCEVVEGWMERAAARLRERPELAAVCGRRRERFPEASIYNRVCDIEWNTPVGDARACGGDAMIRLAALDKVGGYDPHLIAGEEPELCVRLRAAGYRIERLDAEMTLHDAAMTQASQWWRRNVRAGHAYAEGVSMHGRAPERHCVGPLRRALFWGGGVPLVALVGALPTSGLSLLLLGGYPVSAARAYQHVRRRGWSRSDALLGAISMTAGKFPELQGVMKFHWNRLSGRRSGLIEYKHAGTPPEN
jgi:hypothetical protein